MPQGLLCLRPGANGRRKLAFAFESDAKSAGRDLGKKYGVSYRAYRCPHCNHFHLTTQQDRRGKLMATETAEQTLRLNRLEISNFMRVEARRIDAMGRHVVITGPNAGGKTSVCEALFAALKGAGRDLPEPIRRGSSKAQVKLDLGEYQVERIWSEKGARLVVTAANGSRVAKPQQLLDGLLGQFALDPVAFLERRPIDQVDDVLAIAGVKPPADQVAEITGEREDPRPGESADTYLMRLSADESGLWYVRRREANRAWAQKVAAETEQRESLQALGGPLAESEQEPSPLAIADQIAALHAKSKVRLDAAHAVDRALNEHHDGATRLEQRQRELSAAQDYVAEAEKTLEVARAKVADLRERIDHGGVIVAELAEAASAAKAAADALPDPTAEIADLRQQLAAAEQAQKVHGRRRHAHEQLERLAAEAATARAEHERQDAILAALRELRAHLLDGIDLGVPGLAVGDGELRLNGVSFRQASHAERLKIACAVAMRQQPKLRLLRLDNAEGLDQASKDLVFKLANENDWQCIMTCVADEAGLKVEIVDGE